jgi:hypothetical protein
MVEPRPIPMEIPIAQQWQVPFFMYSVIQLHHIVFKTQVNMGGSVPKSYYFSGKPDTTSKTLLTVASGSIEHLEFQVEKAGDVLK